VNVFFLAAVPRILRGNYSLVAIDSGAAIFDLDLEHPVSGYQATSRLTNPDAKLLRTSSDSSPAPVLLNYLQLPALDPRIPQLAQQIAASADNNYDRAKAIENYLRTHFQYTLQLPRTVQRDPLANFLFERKQGHCEYFASSMAVMLRTLQIPSRVVNGFRTGEFNDLTSQYLVRASDAHSWVEAYFAGYGWVSFDPTPAGPGVEHGRWSRMMMYWDAMQSFWREWIVNFDTRQQQPPVVRAGTKLGTTALLRIAGCGPTHSEKNTGFSGALEHRGPPGFGAASFSSQCWQVITWPSYQAHCRASREGTPVGSIHLV